MATTSDIKTGLIIKLDNNLYSVVEFGQNKTARAAAKVWAKLKGVDNSRTIEHTWNSGEKIEPVRVENRPYQFLYKDDLGYHFMNTENYEQITLEEQNVDKHEFLKDGQEVNILINTENDQPLGVELPKLVELKVTYTEPGLKGDTATRTLKPATLETGASINVPLFIDIDEVIKVDTQTGSYSERVK